MKCDKSFGDKKREYKAFTLNTKNSHAKQKSLSQSWTSSVITIHQWSVQFRTCK